MTILIAGFGYVGQRLGEFLVHAGRDVVGARRSGPRAGDSVPVLRADFSRDLLDELPDAVDQVVYMVSADARTREDYHAAYPQGVANLKKRYCKARFLFVSSTSVYAQTNGEDLNDESPAEAEGDGPEALRLAERLVLEQNESPRSHVVVRASGIYGPGRIRFASALRSRALEPEEASLFTNRIHRDDLARALALLLGRESEGGIFVASDRHSATVGEIKEFLDDLLPPRSVPPDGPSRATSASASATSASAPRERKSRRFTPTRLLSLGFQFTYPSYREGYRALFS